MKEAFKSLIETEWQKIQPDVDLAAKYPVFWSYHITPPFPATWPLADNSRLYYYVFAYGRGNGLADGVYVAAPWARVEVYPGDMGLPSINLLMDEIVQIGVQGERPLNAKEIAISKIGESAEAYLATLATMPDKSDRVVFQLKEYYCQWLRFSGIEEQIGRLHESFIHWLACEQFNVNYQRGPRANSGDLGQHRPRRPWWKFWE